MQLGEINLHHVTRMGLDLAESRSDALHVEAILLELAKLLEAPRPPLRAGSAVPDWLRQALLKAEKPEVFSGGVAGFVHVSRRSSEHVTRTCVEHLGKTPTRIVEALRIRWAERQLRLTSSSVTEIAFGCGYATTAQFHHSFRAVYGRTPLRYRRWSTGS